MTERSLAHLFMFVPLLAVSIGCGHGKYVNIDPIYQPVQQVHHSFYRDPSFKHKGKKVAVFDFKGVDGQGHVLADTLASHLFHAKVQVVERQNLQALLKEIRLAQSGKQSLSDTAILQKVGQMLGVDVIIVGGIVAYQESISQLKFNQKIQIPFDVYEYELNPASGQQTTVGPPEGVITYRWKPGSYKTPAGIPTNSTLFASARAIEIATGKIVWIDTVSVRTSGITQTTGLERLGWVMAWNYSGKFTKKVELYVSSGKAFKYPPNWNKVQEAWKLYLRRNPLLLKKN